MCKKIKLSVILRGATLIQGATFIVFAKFSWGEVYSELSLSFPSTLKRLFSVYVLSYYLYNNYSFRQAL